MRTRVDERRRSRAGIPIIRWPPGLRTKDFKLDHASVFEAGARRWRGSAKWKRPGDRGARRQAQDRGAGLPSRALRRCATNWPRRCCSPTCCAGCRPRFSGAAELTGGSVGTVKAALDPGREARRDVKVTGEDGTPLPFTLRDVAQLLRRRARRRAGAGRRSRICVLADAARAVGVQVGAARRTRITASRSSPRSWQRPPTCGRGWRLRARSGCWPSGSCTDASAARMRVSRAVPIA